jgi:all-trans-retinol dehydrogenase (NAD+)
VFDRLLTALPISMLRFWTIALASAVLLAYAPSRLPQWQLLPLSDDQYGYALTGLKCILAFNLLLELNSLLNLWAENRWMWSSDKSVWEWKKEVAVVTGGSNGIGALVVRRLVSYGIRVAVLDVEPLSNALQHGMPRRTGAHIS